MAAAALRLATRERGGHTRCMRAELMAHAATRAPHAALFLFFCQTCTRVDVAAGEPQKPIWSRRVLLASVERGSDPVVVVGRRTAGTMAWSALLSRRTKGTQIKSAINTASFCPDSRSSTPLLYVDGAPESTEQNGGAN